MATIDTLFANADAAAAIRIDSSEQVIIDTSTNTGSIATNTGSIATNTGSISTNTGSIATNTGSIATNTGSIATLITLLQSGAAGQVLTSDGAGGYSWV